MLLADQDRALWDRELIAEGHALVRACLRRNAPGPFQIQAAINAVHTDAADAAATDWAQVVALYDQLLAVLPTDVVRLNRAVAVAEVDGPGAGLLLRRRARLSTAITPSTSCGPTCSRGWAGPRRRRQRSSGREP